MRRSTVITAFALFFALLANDHVYGQRTVGDDIKPELTKPAFRTYFDGYSGNFAPEWTTDIMVETKNDLSKKVRAPFFKNGMPDMNVVNQFFYEVQIETPANYDIDITGIDPINVTEEASDLYYRTMAESGMETESEWYPEKFVVKGQSSLRNGKRIHHLYIYPLLISSDGGRIKKAESIGYSISKRPSTEKVTGSSQRTYANSSVLATGKWYKIGITRNGIYKLDYSFFQGLGVDPSGIDPRTIRIHGNGGGMLPQEAGAFPYDDLVENAIFVSGQGDGSFDSGDHVLFFGTGPHQWTYFEKQDRYVHHYNVYSDTAYYFLTWGGANGTRIQTIPSESGTTYTPTDTRKYSFHEKDLYNSILSGRSWLGETFDLTKNQVFNFNTPNVVSGTNAIVTTRVAATSTNISSSFAVKESGTTYETIPISATSTVYGSYDYRTKYAKTNIPSSALSDGSAAIELVYSKPQTSSVGYLDFIELEYREKLNTGGSGAWYFNATDNTGPGQVFEFNINGTSSSHRVWDITDCRNVREINASISGSTMTFGVKADSIKQFVAFTSSGYLSPASVYAIANQDLHSQPQADYLIIAPEEFMGDANRLANFHRLLNGWEVNVTRLDRIYNEFGSGALDPVAIRDYVKMFWDRGITNGTKKPKFVLLFGDGSYDYKGITGESNAGKVPTYESRRSNLPTSSFTSDDFFGFLDDGEGFWGEDAGHESSSVDILYYVEGDTTLQIHDMEVAVGRLPVAKVEEATAIVQKIIDYNTDPEGFGPWRNKVVLVADHKDDDGSTHVTQADSYTNDIEDANECINIEKIYMDNYIMENTASGSRFPDGKEALLKAMNEGSLIVNYTGHGGEIGWSNASILEISDINQMENGSRLPAYITATCEFGRWDDPARKSGAEHLLLHENGGAIALFTTVRVVYSSPNYTLNTNFYRFALSKDDTLGRMPTIGEVYKNTKNVSWSSGIINNRNFSLLGDPAMQLAYPELKIVVTKINNQPATDSIADTLSALNLITIEGEVQDDSGQLQQFFSGDLFVTVFDKPSKFTTKRAPYTFYWQRNKVFNGQVSVIDGAFKIQFVVPIDISYDDGFGKISLYANNTSKDAAGCNKNIIVGGDGQNTIVDNKPPELELFMNDETFVDGGLVGTDPLLIATVFDEYGINTVGSGIGHELTAVLNGDESNVAILNDFYLADKDSYQNGRIEYPYKDLPEGEHILRVKVWDVANNSMTGEVSFIVADDATFALGHVLNYPNPFSTNTSFFVEHNRNGRMLEIYVNIYTTSGKVVKKLQDTFYADGNLYRDLQWDGLDDYGDAIGRGVYVYEVIVKDLETGERVSTYEKLVLLR